MENFQGPHAQPTFNFNNLLDLVQDKPFTETAVAYNPIIRQAGVVGLERRFENLRPVRPGHLESQAEPDADLWNTV